MAGGGAEDLPHHPSPHLTLTGAVQDSSNVSSRISIFKLRVVTLLIVLPS